MMKMKKGNTSSNTEDEDMGDTSADDKGENDRNKSSIIVDELRLTRVKPPNIKQKNEVCSSDDEGKDM